MSVLNLLKQRIRELYWRYGKEAERNRQVWLRDTLAKIPKGKKILDAGAGECQFKKFCTHLEYVSQDLAKYDGRGDEVGFQSEHWNVNQIDIISDITNIPIPNESFDAVMCVEVFEHLPEPAMAVKEFSRILKKGGTLIITAPVCCVAHQTPFFFSGGYSQYWYEKILKQNGFQITELTFNGNFFDKTSEEVTRIYAVANRFSRINFVLKSILFINSIIMMLILKRFSKNDSDSYVIASQGIHLVAQKLIDKKS